MTWRSGTDPTDRDLGGEPLQRLSSEDREVEREARIRVVQIPAGQLRDATQALAHGVAVQVERARDRVHAAVEPQVRLERAHELGVLLVLRERAEDALGERADVVLGPTQDEAVRTEVLEVRRAALPTDRARHDDGLLGLEEREVRAGRAVLRTGDAGGEVLVA